MMYLESTKCAGNTFLSYAIEEIVEMNKTIRDCLEIFMDGYEEKRRS